MSTKRKTLDSWISDALNDPDKDGKCSMISLVHMVGQQRKKFMYGNWISHCIGLMLFLQLVSCKPSTDCTPKSTRCLNNISQICNTDNKWQDVANCNNSKPQSICNLVEEENIRGHTCILKDGGNESYKR